MPTEEENDMEVDEHVEAAEATGSAPEATTTGAASSVEPTTGEAAEPTARWDTSASACGWQDWSWNAWQHNDWYSNGWGGRSGTDNEETWDWDGGDWSAGGQGSTGNFDIGAQKETGRQLVRRFANVSALQREPQEILESAFAKLSRSALSQACMGCMSNAWCKYYVPSPCPFAPPPPTPTPLLLILLISLLMFHLL
eukprot:920161-Pyramimonas_sp.AAC.1